MNVIRLPERILGKLRGFGQINSAMISVLAQEAEQVRAIQQGYWLPLSEFISIPTVVARGYPESLD
jgi:hypothetical protein